MKKILTFIAIISVLTISFTGCGSKIESKLDSKNQSTSKGEGRERQAFSQADLFGEVDSISGTDITLKLIAMPTRPNGPNDKQPNGSQGSDNPNGAKPNEPKPSGSAQPERNGPRQTEYTGKTETISISETTPITAFSRGQADAQKNNIKISDIKKGDRIQVYYSDKEKKTIEKIMVIINREPASPTPAAK